MSVLPRLYDLVGFSVEIGHDSDGVFGPDLWDGGIDAQQEKFNCGLLSAVCLFLFEPTRSADGKVIAWGMKDSHVPIFFEHISYIAFVVLTWYLCVEQVTTPCVMSAKFESLADYSAELTANEDFILLQGLSHLRTIP